MSIWKKLFGSQKISQATSKHPLKPLPEIIVTLHRGALNMFYEEGLRDQTVTLIRDNLDTYRFCLGDDNPYYAAVLFSLAEMYREVENYIEAESFYQQALSIIRKSLEEPYTDDAVNTIQTLYANTMYSLAIMYGQHMDKPVDAESLFRQVIEIRRAILGEDHPDVINAMDALIALNQKLGDDDAAAELMRQVIEIQRRHGAR